MAERRSFAWMDLLWLAFLAGLAVLQPRLGVHKQLTLLAIGAFQILERRFLGWVPERGRTYSVILKILLASLLVDYTGGIWSSYYLIYLVPVVTAAMFFDAWATMAWTMLTSAVYCSFVLWVLSEYEVTAEGATELAIRNLFFFLAAIVVNRFVTENRRQALRYRQLAEALAETNRRLEEAQEEARRSERLAALGQLSAGLAHELRNPLAVIKGSAETLMRKLAAADPLTTEMAGYISSEVNRLNSIVTRFLDFARPLKLERRPEQIPPLIERALKAARDRWPDTKVEVGRQFAAALPEISVDRDLAEQVFTNLVLNAYEAMGPRGGKLCVAAAAAHSDGRRGVEITFEDTGPGIPAELRGQVFNPFFTTKESGVGLGLSIVSKIVDDHRGWIRLTSEPGKGACFRVFLPEGEPPEAAIE
ncbi:MAG: ATP-binding protein [Terriglobia bacterium]|jgi:signal transduction histidine kinase